MQRPVVAIGWDAGGWRGKKQGLAALARDEGGHIRLLQPPSGRSLEQWGEAHLLDRFVEVATGGMVSRRSHRVVIAIDAPLGFPSAFTGLLNGTAGTVDLGMEMIHNRYAFRETDRNIAGRFKMPLSASFDKLGNNATVAMHHVQGWRQQSLRVLPFDEDDGVSDIGIEVYPAIVCDAPGGERPAWLQQILDLAKELERGSDTQDALVCAALALAYHSQGSHGFPRMVGPDRELPAGEGWIYTPESVGWRGTRVAGRELGRGSR